MVGPPPREGCVAGGIGGGKLKIPSSRRGIIAAPFPCDVQCSSHIHFRYSASVDVAAVVVVVVRVLGISTSARSRMVPINRIFNICKKERGNSL